MNSDFVVSQAALLAERAQKEAGNKGSAAVVRRCFSLLLARQPAAAELKACLQVAKERGLPIVCRALINSNEFAFLP
jgi:hypothetical protein